MTRTVPPTGPASGDAFVKAFEASAKGRASSEPAWLAALRRDAIVAFSARGLPTTKDEAWRQTSVEPIARERFTEPAAGGNGLPAERVQHAAFHDASWDALVFVDGAFSTGLSSPPKAPEGVVAGSLAEALRGPEAAAVRGHLTRDPAPAGDRAFVALNTAFFRDGAYVRVPRDTVLPRPLHLVFVSTGRGGTTMVHPRNLLVAERGSEAHVIETYVGLGDGLHLTNAVTEILAEEGAVVDHAKVQRESPAAFHVATIAVRQGRGSSLTTASLSVGAALARNDIDVVFDGEGASATLNGLFLGTGSQHVDHHTTIDHAKPHCTSREFYKGILAGHARGVFYGKILVRPGAQKTDANQTNKNLLLSPHALVDSVPALDIRADDVKCSHGSTIGSLDKDAVFYLRTRGIDEPTARTILTRAFAGEVLDRLRVKPLRERLDGLVSVWFAAATAATSAHDDRDEVTGGAGA